MATTTKTLTPTNQTVTLPDMTEKPNSSVLVDGIGKDADAINALDTKITTVKNNRFLGSNGTFFTISADSYSNNLDSIVDYIHSQLPNLNGYYSADISGNLTNPNTGANRNFIYGFSNTANTFCWVRVESFAKSFKGIRSSSPTFVFTEK